MEFGNGRNGSNCENPIASISFPHRPKKRTWPEAIALWGMYREAVQTIQCRVDPGLHDSLAHFLPQFLASPRRMLMGLMLVRFAFSVHLTMQSESAV
jgi:hypothetical protein